MFKRVISACMAVVMTSTAFFNVSKNDSINTISTNETTVMETSGDIITSEEALTEAGILTDEVSAEPEETEEPDEETTTEAVTEDDISSETTTETSERTTESAGDGEKAATEGTTAATEQPEVQEEVTEEAATEEIELYAAGSCTVIRTGSYSALGAPGHTFSTVIDGKTYYPLCCDSSKGSADASGAAYNQEGLITKDPSSMIYKTMYYGYGGPEQWSGFSSTDEAVVATARNLSYYTNNDGTPGNNFFRFLQTADTPPAHTFQLSSTDASLSDVTYNGNVYQGSKWITLNMDDRLTAELDAPSDVIIQINSGGSISNYSGTTGIDIAGGEAFRVLGAKSLSGDKTVKLHYDGDKMIAVYGLSPAGNSSLQRLLYRDQENPAKDITFRFSGLGALKINKKSADESVTKNNDCYDFEGIEYALYKQGTKQQLATFVMDKDGKGAVGEITAAGQTAGISKGGTYLLNVPLGNYDIQEIKTNGHYNIDTKAYGVTINQAYDSNQSDTVCEKTFTDTPKMDPVVIAMEKHNEEGDTVKGAADLEGAQYTIKYYAGDYELNNLPATATRTWVIQTKYRNITNSYGAILDKDYLVAGDAFYLDELGIPLIPHGTITIQETKAPKGYKLEGGKLYLAGASINDNVQISGDIVLAKVTDEGLNVRVNSSNSVDKSSAEGINILQKEEMIRGDFSLVKKDYRTGEGMAYIPFLIESKTTGEKHVVCTDENGVFSTASSFQNHSVNTNGNDALMDEEIIDDIQPCGVWFYGNEKAESSTGADDIKGALPYDTYVITELLCERNKDYQLADPFEVTIDSDETPAAAREIVNVPKPELKTTAWTGEKDNHVAKLGTDVILTDTCEYSYLTAGQTYTLYSVFVDALGNPVKDASGKYIKATKVFTLDEEYNVSRYEKCGSIDVSCTVNATDFSGFTGTFFEYLSFGDTSSVSIVDENGNIDVTAVNVVAEHTDAADISQQIKFIAPSIRTTLVNKENGSRYAVIKKDMQLLDKVSCIDLAGGKYVLEGVIMNKRTWLPVMSEGNEVTASTEFEVDENFDGTVEVTYSFDGTKSDLIDKDGNVSDVVCFERLYIVDGDEKKLLAVHEDINDTDQTVRFSYIKTYAKNKADGSKEIKAGDKEVTVTDTISYFNFPEGEYVLYEYMMDRATGEPVLVNGEKICVTKPFQSDASGNGTVDVDYTFVPTVVMDATGTKDIVFFSEVYLSDGETLVCDHKDINDEDQTIHIFTQPKTGDRNNPFIIFSIAVLCLLGIMLLISCRKRTEKRCSK